MSKVCMFPPHPPLATVKSILNHTLTTVDSTKYYYGLKQTKVASFPGPTPPSTHKNMSKIPIILYS